MARVAMRCLVSAALILTACLLLGAVHLHHAVAAGFADEMVADIRDVTARGYDAFDVVATYSQDGRDFIGIAATATLSADGYNNRVFFYDGVTYLGTDTRDPSPGVQLVGSPYSGEITVEYTNYAPDDPLCCPSRAPVYITYTYYGGSVTPDGTPPGH